MSYAIPFVKGRKNGMAQQKKSSKNDHFKSSMVSAVPGAFEATTHNINTYKCKLSKFYSLCMY